MAISAGRFDLEAAPGVAVGGAVLDNELTQMLVAFLHGEALIRDGGVPIVSLIKPAVDEGKECIVPVLRDFVAIDAFGEFPYTILAP